MTRPARFRLRGGASLWLGAALAAAINWAGKVLSQPPISTTESIGWARIKFAGAHD